MKFLEKYDFSKETIADFLNNSPKKLIDAIKDHKKLVGENLDYLKKHTLKDFFFFFCVRMQKKHPDPAQLK